MSNPLEELKDENLEKVQRRSSGTLEEVKVHLLWDTRGSCGNQTLP